jgi:hypothetical protein
MARGPALVSELAGKVSNRNVVEIKVVGTGMPSASPALVLRKLLPARYTYWRAEPWPVVEGSSEVTTG